MEIRLLRRILSRLWHFALRQQISASDPALTRLKLKIDKSSVFCL
jgi:hypothetical protein